MAYRQLMTLALRDFGHEWRMSSSFVVALAAVLAPMLILFGLKFGIITSMLEQLTENPRNREVSPIGSGHFDGQWFETMRNRPDVAFVVPRTRLLAATIKLSSPTAPRILPAELVPTDSGDPLLTGMRVPVGLTEVILSDAAAGRLRAVPGDVVTGNLSRLYLGRRERVEIDLKVIAIAPPQAFSRAGAFVSLDLMVAAEHYRDGRAVPELGWEGGAPQGEGRSYPGYRLYGASIHDVAGLRDHLQAQGFQVRTNAADIETVLAMDRNLSTVFWIVAVVGLVGFSLSLGASLWANVDRKRRELSVLRLVGFRSGGIVALPVLQALFTGVLGWCLALVFYVGVKQAINGLLAAHLNPDQEVCYLLPQHFLAALAITLLAALLAALLGGLRAARIQPSDGLREI